MQAVGLSSQLSLGSSKYCWFLIERMVVCVDLDIFGRITRKTF